MFNGHFKKYTFEDKKNPQALFIFKFRTVGQLLNNSIETKKIVISHVGTRNVRSSLKNLTVSWIKKNSFFPQLSTHFFVHCLENGVFTCICRARFIRIDNRSLPVSRWSSSGLRHEWKNMAKHVWTLVRRSSGARPWIKVPRRKEQHWIRKYIFLMV